MPGNPCTHPPFALRIPPDAADAPVKRREEILAGRITAALCIGWPMYGNGPIVLYSEADSWVVAADTTDVWRTTLATINAKELTDAGFADNYEALHNLRQYDHDISMGTPLVFVRWANVRGKPVDDYRKSHRNSRCC